MGGIVIAVLVTLTNGCGSVTVDTHGARVVSYVPRGGGEVFAAFADGSGGMPICAPYFASLGPKGARRHGTARYQDFKIVRTRESADTSSLELVAESDEATRREFPHDYRVSIAYRLSRTLSAAMRIDNTGGGTMPVTAAFHPYFRVGDATRCRVEGVASAPFAVCPGPSRVFPFASARRTYSLVDPVLARTLEFVSSGDGEAAVWTPGPAPTSESLARQTSRFLPDEWRGFVAVENGLLRRESEVRVPPGGFCTITRTIRDTGAFPYGPDETALWQGRIDAASAAGGGTVAVPAGEHTVAQLKLKSGVTLRLEKGAVLAASTDYADHPAIPGENRGAVVWAEDADRIAIEGEGVLDGRGGDAALVAHAPGRWRGVHFLRCANVRLEDFTLRNAHSWGCYLRECDGVTVRRLKVVNRMNHNNDGIDIASKNVLVEDCDIDAEDDGLVFKNHNPDFVVENVRVRNCRISSVTSFIKIGTETWGGFRNVDIRDCTCDLTSPTRVRDSRRGRAPGCQTLWTGSDGITLQTVDGGFLEDVTVSNVTMKRGILLPLCVRLDNRQGHADGRNSYLRDVLVENVTMELPETSWLPCVVTGASGLRPSGVRVRNCTFKMRACPQAAKLMLSPVPESAGSYPAGSMFGVITPAYGAFVRHADDVTFENVRFDLVGGTDARKEFCRVP